MRILGLVLLFIIASCQQSFYVGEDGEHLVVIDKKIPDDKAFRTTYTVKNITQEKKFLHGSRIFTINSRHVFHIGDTVQLYRLGSGKWRKEMTGDQTTDEPGT